jgi:hypothetical protein
LLIELLVLLSDFLNEHESLVLSKDFNELDGDWVEISSSIEESLIEKLDFFHANTSVLSELLEALRVIIKLTKEHHIFKHIVETFLLRSSGEKNCSISAWDSVFFGRWL